MYKMKYLISKMQCNLISQQMWCLDANVVSSILEVKGSNLINGVFIVNSYMLTEYFFI